MVLATEKVDKKRSVDLLTFGLKLIYMRSLPKATRHSQALENNTFLDACMTEVEVVKSLFRENGAWNDNGHR